MATVRITVTANDEPMQFLTMEDEHGLFEVVLFPQVYRRYRKLIGTLGPYVVTGRVEGRYDTVAVTAERIDVAGPGFPREDRQTSADRPAGEPSRPSVTSLPLRQPSSSPRPASSPIPSLLQPSPS